jgi:TonB family protein
MSIAGIFMAAAVAAAPAPGGPIASGADLPPLRGEDVAWTYLPASQQHRYYPPGALEKGVEGKVVMLCVIDPEGTVGHCRLISEKPAGQDFAAATARTVHDEWKAPRLARDGSPTAGRKVVITLDWKLSER